VLRMEPNDALKPETVIVQPGEWVDANNNENGEDSLHASDNPLGLNIKPLTPTLAKRLKVDDNAGVVVAHVDRNGLAFASGIQEGDIITAIDDHPVTNVRQFLEAMRGVNTLKGAHVKFVSSGQSKDEILKENGN